MLTKEQILDMLDAGQYKELKEELGNMNPVDIAETLEDFEQKPLVMVFRLLAKEEAADAAIIIMSGDYVQRGIPSIMPKHLRTQMALACGADVVLELPVCYATGSAEYFATGAVSLLEALGCVDYLCFGSECGRKCISIFKMFLKENFVMRGFLTKNIGNLL